MQYYPNQRLNGRSISSTTHTIPHQKDPATELDLSGGFQERTGGFSTTNSTSSTASSNRGRSEDIKHRMGYQHRSDADQRAALSSGFNKRAPPSSGSSSIGKASESARHATQMASDLEAQNDELLNEMHAKVIGLKEVRVKS